MESELASNAKQLVIGALQQMSGGTPAVRVTYKDAQKLIDALMSMIAIPDTELKRTSKVVRTLLTRTVV